MTEYFGMRVICPSCGAVSDDDEYCTTCGEVFAQYDELRREGRRAVAIIDTVEVTHWECAYCGHVAPFGKTYNPFTLKISGGLSHCPECNGVMMPIYKRIIDFY